MPSSRRRLLRRLGSAASPGLVSSLAGCPSGASPAGDPSVTPAPVPTTAFSRTPPRAPPPTPDDIELDVAVLRGFTREHPARLEIAFSNASGRPLVGLDGPAYVLPFVDDDYAGETADGTLGLFLAPDDSKLYVDPDGTDDGWVGELLPEAPTDGCWVLPFDWPAARGPATAILNAVRVPPGGTVSHGYTLYFIDGCDTGTFSFENSFDLRWGRTGTPPPPEPYPVTVGFDLTLPAAGDPSVSIHEPTVSIPAAA